VFEVSHLGPDSYLLLFPTQNKINRNHIQIQIRLGVERARHSKGHDSPLGRGEPRDPFSFQVQGTIDRRLSWHMIAHEDQVGSDSTHTRDPKEKTKAEDFPVQDQTSDSTRHTRTYQGQLSGLFVPLDLIAS
jgi:hypothetical protein